MVIKWGGVLSFQAMQWEEAIASYVSLTVVVSDRSVKGGAIQKEEPIP